MQRFARYLLIVGMLSMTAGLVGCNEPAKPNTEDQTRQTLEDRIKELENQLAQAQRDRQGDQDQINALRKELERLRAQQTAAPENWKGVPGGAMTSIEGTILFDSGKAELKASGLRELDKIAATIKSRHPDYDVYVFGHTDDQPIKHSKWVDNYELSCQRSLSVLRALKKDGVGNPTAACGWGEHRPVADNANAEARQANRRVEIYAMSPTK